MVVVVVVVLLLFRLGLAAEAPNGHHLETCFPKLLLAVVAR